MATLIRSGREIGDTMRTRVYWSRDGEYLGTAAPVEGVIEEIERKSYTDPLDPNYHWWGIIYWLRVPGCPVLVDAPRARFSRLSIDCCRQPALLRQWLESLEWVDADTDGQY